MPDDRQRTAERIREEIRAERELLDSDLTSLGDDARRTGRAVGPAVAALAGMVILLRLRARRRRTSRAGGKPRTSALPG